MKKEEKKKRKLNTRDELVARIMNRAALLQQESQDDLRRAARTIVKRVEKCIVSMVGFFNIHSELLQFIEIIYITNKCNQQVICLSFTPFVRRSIPNIQTAVSTHSLKTGQCLYGLIYSE
jgi:hypothetical protein